MDQSDRDRVRTRWLLALGCLPFIVLLVGIASLVVNVSQQPTPTPRPYPTSPPARLIYPTLNLPATMEAMMTQAFRRPTPTLIALGGGQPDETDDDKTVTRTMTPLAETPTETSVGTDFAAPLP